MLWLRFCKEHSGFLKTELTMFADGLHKRYEKGRNTR